MVRILYYGKNKLIINVKFWGGVFYYFIQWPSFDFCILCPLRECKTMSMLSEWKTEWINLCMNGVLILHFIFKLLNKKFCMLHTVFIPYKTLRSMPLSHLFSMDLYLSSQIWQQILSGEISRNISPSYQNKKYLEIPLKYSHLGT